VQSQALTLVGVRADLWCPERIQEAHGAATPTQTHPLNYTPTDLSVTLPKVSEIDCYGCVDWYGYTSLAKPAGKR